MTPEFIYRGMALKMFETYVENNRLPLGTNFTGCPVEAADLGFQHHMEDIIVLGVPYDPQDFAPSEVGDGMSHGRVGWFVNRKSLQFDTLDTTILSTSEARR
jgi:hypothetical protein